jgi:pyruvate dehydrogenase E2 component (dihydrolipoamide acetyltransferase)
MPIQLLMPALSPTMTEGTIGRWIKKEGDQVEPGDVIAEIETDKATMEFEAVDGGILAKIIIPENTHGVKVNSVIALIAEEGEDIKTCIDSYKPVSFDTVPVKEESQVQSQAPAQVAEHREAEGNRVFASPLAKNIASQEGIDLCGVVGSGPYGRIVKDDVLAAKSVPLQIQQPTKSETPIANKIDLTDSNAVELSIMRKVIAQRLVESKTTIPHFYLMVDCNVTKLVQLREQINQNFSQMSSDKKISVNDMIVRATGLALGDMPAVNASWGGDKIIQYNSVDISVAVALDDGLITPIVKNVNHKSLGAISDEVKSLVKKAKEGKLRPEEFQGGSLSISNLGMYSIDSFLAIINPPQSCILSVGGISKKPIVIEDEIAIASMMSIGISCDHRVVDGALAAQFINKIKSYLENPLSLI